MSWKRWKNDFKNPKKNNSFYDIYEDWALIESSFTTQYGIRLRSEPEMCWDEFITLLSGLLPDTPLGKIVAIRSEDDKDTLKHFTPEQRKIRLDWRNKNAKTVQKKDYKQAIANFEKMFAVAFGGGK